MEVIYRTPEEALLEVKHPSYQYLSSPGHSGVVPQAEFTPSSWWWRTYTYGNLLMIPPGTAITEIFPKEGNIEGKFKGYTHTTEYSGCSWIIDSVEPITVKTR